MTMSSNISDILADISERNITDVTSYLNDNYNLTPAKAKSIQMIVELDHAQLNHDVSIITSNVASMLVSDFSPKSYIGRKFGDFISKKLIYSNDKSMVFIGSPKTETYDHAVAIKVITPTHEHIAGLDNLAMQAQYMANIKHTNIVEINSAGTTDDGIQYLVMEYLPGLNIKAHCINNELDFKSRLDLFQKVCAGISKMHSKLIIHSDIKPANIIMDINQNPKVIDFDLSQSNSASLHQDFNYINIKGYTATYAAPEQLLDRTEINTQTDVFGLGGVLFEILTGYPYSKKVMSTKDCIRHSLGNISRGTELAFIIDKALNQEPSLRHGSVIELSEDIGSILEGRKISKSYKDSSPLSYKIKHFTLRHKIALTFAMVITLIIGISINQIIEERDLAKKSLQLVMQSNDPRVLNNNAMFEKLASESFERKALNNNEYFEELMGWGETFFGNGMTEKAAKYFEKALTLYTDTMSDNRIRATTRLLQTYYSLARSDSYLALVSPYLNAFKTGEIHNPYLIELFLVLTEIDSRYDGDINFGEMKYTASEILTNINLDDVREKELRENLKISLLIEQGRTLYYSLPHDHVSTRSYISDEEYEDSTKPALLKSVAIFENALSIIRVENIKTHLEPLIHLWISYLYSELAEYVVSETYLNLALNKTISIFGEFHSRVTAVYLKAFAMYRYRSPEKAVQYAQLAYNSYKKRKLNEHDLQIMTWVYLIISHFNNGDYINGIREMKEFQAAYETFDTSTKLNAAYLNSTGFYITTFAYLDMPDVDKIISYTADLELVLAKHGVEYIDLQWVDTIRARELGDTDKLAELLEKQSQHVEFSDFFDDDTKVTEYLFLATACGEVPTCDTLKYANKIEKYMKWSTLDNEMSVEKLNVLLQLSNYYVQQAQYIKAKSFLDELEPIIKRQTFQFSFLKSYYYKLNAEIAFAQGKHDQGDKFKNLAIPGALYNFGNTAKFTKELMGLK